MKYVRKLPFLIGASIIGTLFLSGRYFLIKQITYVPTYQATSSYYVDYGVDPKAGDTYTYINAYSWNVWIHTDEMVEEIQSHLPISIDEEELKGYLYADLPGDLRMPVTTITTEVPEMTLLIAHAVEEAMIAFGNKQKEIQSIRVIDSPSDTEKAPLLTEPGKHIAQCALLSILIVGIWFVLSELLSDAIWVPSDLADRCKIPILGDLKSSGLSEHLRYFFAKDAGVAITTVTKEACPFRFRDLLYEATGYEEINEWAAIPSAIDMPSVCKELRKTGQILLAVPVGKRMRHKTDYVLHYLSLQDCRVTAIILWNEERKPWFNPFTKRRNHRSL
jgi:capsular polysaccharide biosynthesis protein